VVVATPAGAPLLVVPDVLVIPAVVVSDPLALIVYNCKSGLPELLIAIRYVPVESSASPIVFNPLNDPALVDVLVEYGDPDSCFTFEFVSIAASGYPVIEFPPAIPPLAT
jgi:hypothetical protein